MGVPAARVENFRLIAGSFKLVKSVVNVVLDMEAEAEAGLIEKADDVSESREGEACGECDGEADGKRAWRWSGSDSGEGGWLHVTCSDLKAHG